MPAPSQMQEARDLAGLDAEIERYEKEELGRDIKDNSSLGLKTGNKAAFAFKKQSRQGHVYRFAEIKQKPVILK